MSQHLKQAEAAFAIFDLTRDIEDDELAERMAEIAIDAGLEMRKDEIRIRLYSTRAA